VTLAEVKRGQKVRICQIPDPLVRAQAIRFGVVEGSLVVCLEVVPGGPVIIRKGMQDLAVGRRLASRILVRPVHRAA